MQINIVELEKGFAPVKATEGAACMDVFARHISFDDETGYLRVKLGFMIEVPDGYVMELIPRSSVSNKGLHMCNSVGQIDSDFRGEVEARFYPAFVRPLIDSIDAGGTSISKYMMDMFSLNEAVAQVKITKHTTNELIFNSVEELSTTKRGSGGHGSTNKK